MKTQDNNYKQTSFPRVFVFSHVFRGYCSIQGRLALLEVASNSSAFANDLSPLPFYYLSPLVSPCVWSVALVVPGLPDR